MRGRDVAAALSAVFVAPVGALALALRPAWRVGLSERLGALPPESAPAPADVRGPVWIHAASAGEVLAGSSLVARWRAEGRDVFASATSPTGRALWAARWPDVPSGLAPLDHPWCVDRALDGVRPSALVLVETELWPVWIAAAVRRGVPVCVVSGRVGERSLARRRWLGGVLRRTMHRLAAVGAATPEDAERFAALGVPGDRIRVTGDLKLERPAEPGALASDLAAALADRPVLVAGSTHPGEERAVADAMARVEAEGLSPRVVLAPRRLERLEAIERELGARGRKLRRRSRLGESPLLADEWLLVDTMGELPSIYAAADIAFVGGSLVPVGGHNLAEPVGAGAPVLHGPHVERVRHVADILHEAGAARGVADAEELGAWLLRWLRDPSPARAGARRGASALERRSGSVDRTAGLLEAAWRGAPLPAPSSGVER